jgi:hypothetical protein
MVVIFTLITTGSTNNMYPVTRMEKLKPLKAFQWNGLLPAVCEKN